MYVYWTHARIQVQHTTLHEASNPAKWRCERHAACLEDATDATQPLWPTLPVARGWCCNMLLVTTSRVCLLTSGHPACESSPQYSHLCHTPESRRPMRSLRWLGLTNQRSRGDALGCAGRCKKIPCACLLMPSVSWAGGRLRGEMSCLVNRPGLPAANWPPNRNPDPLDKWA